MKNVFMFSAFIVASISSAAQARISNGTAAELGTHRVEKLVLLKKVPTTFREQFLGIEVRSINPGGGGKPSFEVIASQDVDAGKAANKVIMTMDENGKVLSDTVVTGTAPTAPLKWPGKDPVSLTELGFHHVEHVLSDKKVAPFYNSFKAMRLSQMQHGSDTMVVLEMLSEATKDRLLVNLKSDGSLIGYSIEAAAVQEAAGTLAEDVGAVSSPLFSAQAVSAAKDLVVKGDASGVCSPLIFTAAKGVSTKITLKATGQMFILNMPQAGVSLMAGAGGADSKTVKFAKSGTYAFQCGVHGGKQSAGKVLVK